MRKVSDEGGDRDGDLERIKKTLSESIGGSRIGVVGCCDRADNECDYESFIMNA